MSASDTIEEKWEQFILEHGMEELKNKTKDKDIGFAYYLIVNMQSLEMTAFKTFKI